MVGRVGVDVAGDWLIERLALGGVDVTGVRRDPSVGTGTALIVVGEDGENSIVVVPGANGTVDAAQVDESGALDRADVVLLQLETPIDVAVAAATDARRDGCTVLLDPAPAQPTARAALELADYVTPNESELLTLCGERPRPELSLEDARTLARRLVDTGCRRLIVKLGAAGALLVGAGRRTILAGFRGASRRHDGRWRCLQRGVRRGAVGGAGRGIRGSVRVRGRRKKRDGRGCSAERCPIERPWSRSWAPGEWRGPPAPVLAWAGRAFGSGSARALSWGAGRTYPRGLRSHPAQVTSVGVVGRRDRRLRCRSPLAVETGRSYGTTRATDRAPAAAGRLRREPGRDRSLRRARRRAPRSISC